MDIQEYYNKINDASQAVFTLSIDEKRKIGQLHHSSSCLYEFSNCVVDVQEKNILETVSAQLESANFSLSLGLYRQSFASLRLALEMGLGAIYFSYNKMELYEWHDGRNDIKWSKLIDEEKGVLSKRFVKAFFGGMEDEIEGYRKKAMITYRKLSEYVHGNWETWDGESVKITYSSDVFDRYCNYNEIVVKVILFAAICRYVKEFDEGTRESLQFVPEEFGHIENLRDLFGQS